MDIPKMSLHELSRSLVLKLLEHHHDTGIETSSSRIFGHSDFTAFFKDGPAGEILVKHGCVIYTPSNKERC